ncbi:MAG: hypothetical protein ABR598_00770 [Candidatus Dormibacteria bacterium]
MSTGPQEATESARRAVDPDRLMPSENPSTRYLSDVVHWMKVYSELAELKDDLIELAERRLLEMDPSGAKEIRESDIVMLRAEKERFMHRLEFWKSRHRELDGG